MFDFLERLAEERATPGGGGAAAASGAMGAALLSMSCRLTLGRKRFAAVDAVMVDTLSRSESLRLELTQLVERDAQAFEAVMAAYRLAKTTAAAQTSRQEQIQAAMKTATLVPLAIAQACAQVVDLCDSVMELINPNALGDATVARICALAGLEAALITAQLNLNSIKDSEFVRAEGAKLNRLAGQHGLTHRLL